MEFQHRKICRLVSLTGRRPERQPVPFLNLSDRAFTPEERKTLEMGPKFMFPKKPKVKDIIPYVETIVQTTDKAHQEEVRNIVYHEVKNLLKKPKTPPLKEIGIIKQLKSDPDLIIIQTDKSNKLAVLKKEEYVHKMLECINLLEGREVKKDPNKNIYRKTEELIKHGKWPNYMKNKVKLNVLGVTPRIIGRLKDHKNNLPIRPIVTKCAGPTYFLEKAFVPCLKLHLPETMFNIKSTKEFVQRIQTVQLPETYLLASLDIVSLYPSLDMKEINERISQYIDEYEDYNPEVKMTLKSGLNLIMNYNFFIFNGKFYKQDKGAPMGSPISGLLAEYKLRPLENYIFETFELTPLFWLRYVDDIFIIWPHNRTELNSFVTKLNELDNNIKFTLEIEEDGNLPFLDVMLMRKKQSLERRIYRKPMANPSTIPFDASSPLNYKLAAYRFFIKRAFEICTPDYLNDELHNIRKIAWFNGFPPSLINRIILNQVNCNSSRTPFPLHSISTLPYFPGLFEKLKLKLRPFNIHLIAKPPAKLKNLIYNKIDPIHFDNYAGVYQIPYLTKDGNTNFYIGKTQRKFVTRKKEHMTDIKYSKETTALARLNIKDSIQISFDDSKIIFKSEEFLPSMIRESIEIITRKDTVCNSSTSFHLDELWTEMLLKPPT